MLSDLRDSGSLEQDADVVLFLYRDAVYNPGSDANHLDVIIGKKRDGRTGIVPCHWDGHSMAIGDGKRTGYSLKG